ncbi:MAG: uracil-DNA glycosylase family protein [Bulleidia sp.]|nr:uracil-DNA glycosylase family protein [Bulleidia sp.]
MMDPFEERIRKIREEIDADPDNAFWHEQGIGPVFQASPEARIVLIGQAPGRKVQETGIPFNDQSGRTLMSWLGMDEPFFHSEKVGILPVDFYYPGKGKSGDLPPRTIMASRYHDRLLACMPKAKLRILIGRYAVDWYLKDRMKENLTETVRNYKDYLPEYFPVVHPSPLNQRWQKNNPWFMEEVVPALQKEILRTFTG